MILYLGNKLSKHGFTPTSIETLGTFLSSKYQVIYASDKLNPVLRLWDMVYTLIKNRKNIKVVLLDTYSSKAFYYALIISILARIINVKYIPILRGGNLPVRIDRSPFLSSIIFRNSLTNVAPSNYLKDKFKKKGYDVVFIPNNIPIKNYSFRKRDKFRPKLLFVRSFHHTYNPMMAVEVLKQLLTDYPEAKLGMVGPDKDGTLKVVEQKIRELEIQDSVTIYGRLPKEEWIKLSKDYDIFINPTDFDNTPISVIEAMALGLPVVSTNAGGIPYLLSDGVNALLVPVKDKDQMENKVRMLLADNDLGIRLSENARKFVEGFDWEVVKNKWFSILDDDL
jgi:glycosyltransferase involved in cell wall biosynthesis